MPKAAQEILEFEMCLLKRNRATKTSDYKKKTREIDAKLKEIMKVKKAKEVMLSKLNAEIENLGSSVSEELPYYNVKFY